MWSLVCILNNSLDGKIVFILSREKVYSLWSFEWVIKFFFYGGR